MTSQELEELLDILVRTQKQIGVPVLLGLGMPILFYGDQVKVGCTTLTIDEWNKMDARAALKAGSSTELYLFLKLFRPALTALAIAIRDNLSGKWSRKGSG